MTWAFLYLQQTLQQIMQAGAAQGMAAPTRDAWRHPGSNLAHLIAHETWFSFWWVFPFIMLAYILLVYVMVRFRDKGDGRQPSEFHENNPLETAWTVIPLAVVILVAFHSFGPLHFMEYGGNHPAITINVVGHQFFWEYKYPQYGIDMSNATLVLPANQVVDLDLTSVDVIHGFYVPGLGVQEDALPGRITNLWFKAQPGYYKGQCDQLCGDGHSGMFIEVQVLPDQEFQQWLQKHRSQPAPAKAASSTAELQSPAAPHSLQLQGGGQ